MTTALAPALTVLPKEHLLMTSSPAGAARGSRPRPTSGPGCSCGKPTGDNAYLCQACTSQMVTELRLLAPATTEVPINARWARDHEAGGLQLRDDEGRLVPVAFGRQTSTRWDTPVGSRAGLTDHLEVTVSRQARISDKGARGTEKPVPFNPRAAEVRGRLDQQLRPWALWLAGQLPAGRRATAVHDVTRAPLPVVVGFLAQHAETIRHSPTAGQLAHAVTDAVATVRKVIDRPGRQRYGGACGAELATGVLCGAALYAEEDERHFECRACGTRWSVEERQAWLRNLTADELATAPLIASALSTEDDKLDVKRIHQWVTRKQLIPHGYTAAQACNAHRSQSTAPVAGCEDCAKKKGQPLIRVGDVQQLLVQHAQRKARAEERRARKTSRRIEA